MRAARLHAAKDLQIHQEPDPTPGENEELVQITAVGLCGSDLHWYDDGGIGDAILTTPVVPGHEFAGVIASGPRKKAPGSPSTRRSPVGFANCAPKATPTSARTSNSLVTA